MKCAFEKYDKEKMACAKQRSATISLKYSVEVARFIRGKKLNYAINLLNDVIQKKQVIPYKRYFKEVAHKKGAGISTGGYPVNVSKEFLRVLNSAKKNAQEKEFGKDLYILSISCRKGTKRMRQGRYFRRKKSTHLEVIVGSKK